MQTVPHDMVTIPKNLLKIKIILHINNKKKIIITLHILIFPTICKYTKAVISYTREGAYHL